MKNEFIFETIRPEYAKEAGSLEAICFPPNEACSMEQMLERAKVLPESFLVAKDKANGKIAGYINGLATNEEKFLDEFFLNASLHDPKAKNSMIMGLAVLPEYQNQGLAHQLVDRFKKLEKAQGRKALVLTCHDYLVPFYSGMGFNDKGISGSAWGGEVWHEMHLILE